MARGEWHALNATDASSELYSDLPDPLDLIDRARVPFGIVQESAFFFPHRDSVCLRHFAREANAYTCTALSELPVQ